MVSSGVELYIKEKGRCDRGERLRGNGRCGRPERLIAEERYSSLTEERGCSGVVSARFSQLGNSVCFANVTLQV